MGDDPKVYRIAATDHPSGTVAYLDAALRKARAERLERGTEDAGLQHVGRALDGVLARLSGRFAA